MRRKLALALIALALPWVLVACTAGNAAPDIPPGIKESQWKPLGQDLGLVVQNTEAKRMMGYFMCKVEGKWTPLSIQNPVAVVPAQ